MEVLVFFGFMALVFGGIYLMLACGYRSIEAEREKQRAAQSVGQSRILAEPRFFANVQAAASAGEVPAVPAHLLARLEQRLQRDYQGAAMFANQPSKERICSGYGAYVDAVASELERHIQLESAATSAFVALPSVERLYDKSTDKC